MGESKSSSINLVDLEFTNNNSLVGIDNSSVFLNYELSKTNSMRDLESSNSLTGVYNSYDLLRTSNYIDNSNNAQTFNVTNAMSCEYLLPFTEVDHVHKREINAQNKSLIPMETDYNINLNETNLNHDNKLNIFHLNLRKSSHSSRFICNSLADFDT